MEVEPLAPRPMWDAPVFFVAASSVRGPADLSAATDTAWVIVSVFYFYIAPFSL